MREEKKIQEFNNAQNTWMPKSHVLQAYNCPLVGSHFIVVVVSAVEVCVAQRSYTNMSWNVTDKMLWGTFI